MKKMVSIGIIVVLISFILISSYNIFNELQENKNQEIIFEELEEILEQENNEEQRKEQINLKELYKKNNDFLGWINIEDTTISYPVMQKRDIPNYYLQRDFYQNYSSYGTPYLSEECNINSDNLIIYAHHMKNQKMFRSFREL